MRLPVHRAEHFTADFERQYRWYLAGADEVVAERDLAAVSSTLKLLAEQPGIGRPRRFRHPALQGLRSYRVQSPFGVHLVFYRIGENRLVAERVMHGARDLPRRLTEPPSAE